MKTRVDCGGGAPAELAHKALEGERNRECVNREREGIDRKREIASTERQNERENERESERKKRT